MFLTVGNALVIKPDQHRNPAGLAIETRPGLHVGRAKTLRRHFASVAHGTGRAVVIFMLVLVYILVAGCGPEEPGSGHGTEQQNNSGTAAEATEPVEEQGEAGIDSPGADSGTHPGLSDKESRSPSSNAYDLIEELRALDRTDKDEFDAAAASLLRRLGELGARAVLPIRDMLLDARQSDDVPLALREALLDVLLDMNIPDVEPVALELLAGNPAASEVWRIGSYLEWMQPGTYSDSIRQAAEQVLITSDPHSFIPPELFQLLGVVGNTDTAAVLLETPSEQQAFRSMTLAALPQGSGLYALETQANALQSSPDTLQGRLALQLIAQEAPGYPQAATALVRLAEVGAIPRDVWPYVLDIVAGSWELSLTRPAPELLVGSHTYYGAEGDQVIWRVARQNDGQDDGSDDQRQDLLDRLMPLAPADLVWSPKG